MTIAENRKRAINIMVQEGLSYPEIGNILDLTAPRIYQIYRDTEMAGGKYKVGQKQYKRDYKRGMLYINGKRIKVDKRPRPDDICEICGKRIARLEYHHWNDAKTKLGMWICHMCHAMSGGIDKNLHIKYLELKSQINKDMDNI